MPKREKSYFKVPLITLVHSDEVSGCTIFDDGAKVYWSEGPGVEIQVIEADGHRRLGFEDDPYARAMESGIGGLRREMTPWEELEFEGMRNGWDGRDARRALDALREERK